MEQERLAARRKQILTAAAKVFAEKGFQSATIREIARVAGIADGTIYLYFQNKTALLIGLFELVQESLPPEIDLATLDSIDLRTALVTMLRYPLLGFEGESFELFRAVLAEIMVNGELRQLYYDRVFLPTLAIAETPLQHWMAQGRIRAINPHLLSRILSGMVYGLFIERIIGDEPSAAEWMQLPELMADVILGGIEGSAR